MIYFLVLAIAWVYMGLIILKAEIHRKNAKLLDLDFWSYSKVVVRACLYGPLTKFKVIDEL